MAKKQDLTIRRGETFKFVIRWEDRESVVYKPITELTAAAPAVVTATGHGVPDGWDVTIVSVKGMTQINAANSPPKDKDYVRATKLSDNTLELNTVNSAGYSTYTSGGYVQYYEPHDLTSVTARVQIKDKVGGTVLLTSEGVTPTPTITATVNDTDMTITLEIDAADTADITWKKGVYDVEAEDTGVVYALMYGAVSVSDEVTT